MNKNQFTAPMPSVGARALAGIIVSGGKAITWMAALFAGVLGESVTNKRAIWIAASVVSLCLLFICAAGNSVLGALISVGVLYFTGKRADVLYKD